MSGSVPVTVGADGPVRPNILQASSKMLRESGNDAAHRKEDQRALVALLEEHGSGSMLRGWRRALDADGNMEVDYPDFIKAALRLGFCGDAQLLFGMNSDHHTLTLEELAPWEGRLMASFKDWVVDKFGSTRDMFAQFDASRSGRISKDDFSELCKVHGFDSTEEGFLAVFKCCDIANSDFILPEDVVFLEVDPILRAKERHRFKVEKLNSDREQAAQEFMEFSKSALAVPTTKGKLKKNLSPKSRHAPSPWLAWNFDNMPIIAVQARTERVKETMRKEQQAKHDFLRHLRKAYGHEIRALRRVLDPKGTYGFSSQMLRRFCGKNNLNINLQDLWSSLDKDADGHVSLEELSVRRALALASLQGWARRDPCLGSCQAIWESPEAAASSRKLTGTWVAEKKMLIGTFAETLKHLNWPQCKDPETQKLVFSSLDLHGVGMISRADLEWLDRWRPVEWVYAEPDPLAWGQLKDLLVNIYGHPLRAWRFLDRDDSNQIQWAMFKEACRKLRFEKKAASAWRAVDTDLSGTITMNEFDETSAEILRSFKEWAEANFGSVKHCFKAIDSDKTESVTLSELKKACSKLNWDGNVTLLFDCLAIDRNQKVSENKRKLSFHDIAFLETWVFEPSEEELKEEEEKKKSVKSRKKAAVESSTVALNTVCERLASPMDKFRRFTRGFVAESTSLPLPRSGSESALSGWSPLSRSLEATRPPTRCSSEVTLAGAAFDFEKPASAASAPPRVSPTAAALGAMRLLQDPRGALAAACGPPAGVWEPHFPAAELLAR